MAAPALIGLAVFMAIPFGLAIWLSFTNERLDSPLATSFVGLRNYVRLIDDPAFAMALVNNAVFAAVVVPVQTALALALAILVNRRLTGITAFRSIFFLPVVFPMALVAVVWTLIYAPGPNGFVNAFSEALTFGSWQPKDFLNDPVWALPAIMALSIWQGVGFQMVIILAGLQAIPRELYEAASLDRAGRWQQFRHVTLPGLRGTLIFVSLVTTILAFRLFDQVFIMTDGGPNDATTTVMHQTVSAAFEQQNIARASAMTVVFFLIVTAIALIQRRLMHHGETR
ncbi:carbohydrate ABC transporter permease [Streptomyces sp. NPDC008343]|uniref:carbohydrate ABC transporter permease n=1 Tax=Streptomyces sp. NPDC008343 TaxID=3364828 RepID=UPI0036EDB5B0